MAGRADHPSVDFSYANQLSHCAGAEDFIGAVELHQANLALMAGDVVAAAKVTVTVDAEMVTVDAGSVMVDAESVTVEAVRVT